MFAKMTVEKLVLKPDTKNSWIRKELDEREITQKHYDNIVDANKFFRSFGSERVYKTHTRKGYLVTRIVSKDPTGTIKVTRTFEIL